MKLLTILAVVVMVVMIVLIGRKVFKYFSLHLFDFSLCLTCWTVKCLLTD